MERQELQEFIYFLTRSKQLSRAQQRKRDTLLARDCSNIIDLAQERAELSSDVKDSDKHNDGANIASSVESIQDSSNSLIIKENKCHRPGCSFEYISPSYIQNFLREYNQDSVLKYTCHLIDTDETIEEICNLCHTEQYDFKEHSTLILKRFKSLTWKYREQNIIPSSKMTTLITVYLSGYNPNGDNHVWSSDRISINWSCNQIKKWAEDNPHIIPNPGKNIAKKQKNGGFQLVSAIRSKTTGSRIKSFSDLVLFFKGQFHLRKDNPLRYFLNIANQKFDSQSVVISFSKDRFNDNVELLTDIDKLVQAYKVIIGLCIEHKRSNEPAQIELSYFDDAKTNHTYFCIHHLDSVYKKTKKNVLERIGETQANLISNQINGLCDLFVEAVFGDNSCGRVNLWDSKPYLESQPIEENVLGVKYILRF